MPTIEEVAAATEVNPALALRDRVLAAAAARAARAAAPPAVAVKVEGEVEDKSRVGERDIYRRTLEDAHAERLAQAAFLAANPEATSQPVRAYRHVEPISLA
jgi:hypothetical protein